MAKITDLDALLGDDKRVRVKGNVYRLPPDLPVELYLDIQRFAASKPDATQAEQVEKLHEHLLELFRYGDPSIERLPLTITQTVLAIATIYGDQDEDARDDAARPRKPRASGGATGSKTRRTRSRS